MDLRKPVANLRFAARAQVKGACARLGVDVSRIRSASQIRPVGDMRSFLEDVAKRHLVVTDALDVGANRGEWARLVTEVFPGCRVAMIEPQVEMSRYLESFCRSHEGSEWICAGAGAALGTSPLTIWDDLAGSSFLPPLGSVGEKREQRSVRMVTIDALVESDAIRVPQIVKIDVQGFELETLRGATSLFGLTELFIIETSLVRPLGQPLIDEVVAVMRSHGYRVYDLAGFMRRPYDGALGQVDVCFARDGGSLCQSDSW